MLTPTDTALFTSLSVSHRTAQELATPVTLLPHLAFKRFLLKPFGDFGVSGISHSFPILWPYNELFSAQTPTFEYPFGLTVPGTPDLHSVTFGI